MYLGTDFAEFASGPIESFPVMHAVAPAYVNSMQQPQAQVHAVTSVQYVPPAVPSADWVQETPAARGQVVEVDHLMLGSFPTPASTGGATGVLTATELQHPQAQPYVPVAQHVSAVAQHVPEAQGISRNDARV